MKQFLQPQHFHSLKRKLCRISGHSSCPYRSVKPLAYKVKLQELQYINCKANDHELQMVSQNTRFVVIQGLNNPVYLLLKA